MSGDEMLACVDRVEHWYVPPGEEWEPPLLEPRGDRDGFEFLMIDQHCAAQFPGRTVFGTCTETRDHVETLAAELGAPVGTYVNVTQATDYYALDAVTDDQVGAGCIRNGGSWRPIAEDSHEYRRAILERDIERMDLPSGRRRRR